ncbi:MAG: lasso RiPP family leader peptide-containing protein, partial [Acidimicrobiales bacterium]
MSTLSAYSCLSNRPGGWYNGHGSIYDILGANMKIDEYQSPRLVRLGNVRDVTGTGSINKVG